MLAMKRVPEHVASSEASMQKLWTDEELSKLLATGQLRRFPKGQIIFSAGDRSNEIFYIEKGWVNVYRMTQDGQRVSIGLRNEGDFIGISETFRTCTRDCFAEALEKIEIHAIGIEEFRAVLCQSGTMMLRFLEFLSYRLHDAHTSLLDYACNHSPERLAMLLLNMAERSGIKKNGKITISLQLTQEELAIIIGTTRQTVNGLIHSFKEDGCITMNGRIIQEVDPEKLRRRTLR